MENSVNSQGFFMAQPSVHPDTQPGIDGHVFSC